MFHYENGGDTILGFFNKKSKSVILPVFRYMNQNCFYLSFIFKFLSCITLRIRLLIRMHCKLWSHLRFCFYYRTSKIVLFSSYLNEILNCILAPFSFDVDYSVNYFNWDLHHFGLTEMGTRKFPQYPPTGKYQTPKIDLKYSYDRLKHP